VWRAHKTPPRKSKPAGGCGARQKISDWALPLPKQSGSKPPAPGWPPHRGASQLLKQQGGAGRRHCVALPGLASASCYLCAACEQPVQHIHQKDEARPFNDGHTEQQAPPANTRSSARSEGPSATPTNGNGNPGNRQRPVTYCLLQLWFWCWRLAVGTRARVAVGLVCALYCVLRALDVPRPPLLVGPWSA
jgi:hypothetical protein